MSIEGVCIGHASFDLTMVVDGYPSENSKAETQTLVEAGGGPAGNAAYLLSKWGVATAFAGVVGDDAYGHRVAAEFAAAGTDTSLLELRPGHVTPVSFVIVNRSNGSRTIVNRKSVAPAAAAALDCGLVRKWRPKLLLFDGHELAASLAAIDASEGAVTVLDAGSLREGTRALAGIVDYLVCSERFARQVTGIEDLADSRQGEECLARLGKINGKTVVVTLGEKGLIYNDGKQHGHLPAIRARAVDTTAAGDVFHGAFTYALLRKMPLVDALKLATVAAGMSVEVIGGRPSIPELGAVQERMRHA